ncbi:cell wall-binding repeat-containing protein [Halobacillus salinarum]|uniref:Cell wall-binding repeat-containing protein n=1 Tax=Halobacillus salinarum TaxID=2932257 RepID=A0ABY4EIL2_9BACI|nr:cell wall-binding repeat-containing protein [Halobacillus salinarum]UOQ44265.1 cell wall-binding repeat-containing protein [Halobacillus salinarum]
MKKFQKVSVVFFIFLLLVSNLSPSVFAESGQKEETADVKATSEYSQYIQNADGDRLEISDVNPDPVTPFPGGRAGLYDWEQGETLTITRGEEIAGWGVTLIVEDGKLVSYIDYYGNQFSSEHPDGKALDAGARYISGIHIPENGYIVFVGNPTTDNSGKDMRKEALAFAENQLGRTIELNGVDIPEKIPEKRKTLTDETLSKGIDYKEMQISNLDSSDMNERMNIVKADLNKDNVHITTSSALDRVVAREEVLKQAQREKLQGTEVVAGVNADMFNMQTGMNMGLQVKGQSLLVNHSSPSQVEIHPVFGVDEDNQAFVDTLSMEGTIQYQGDYIDIDGLNRNENAHNKLILYTPKLTQSGKLEFQDRDGDFVNDGALAVVKGIKNPGQLKAGQTYQGTIDKIYDSAEEIEIPKDGVIIGGFNDKADVVKSTMQEGTKVSFTFNLYKGKDRTLANDVVVASSGYNWLVKDGKALTKEELLQSYGSALVTASKARTAIGVTEKNEVIAVTFDQPSTLFDESDGVSLTKMAEEMEKLGVVSAVGLDGGGSTEMIAKRAGSSKLSTVNHPSDGSSRPVSNAILFASNIGRSQHVGHIYVDKDITIYKGAQFKFEARVTDENGHTLPSDFTSVTWSTDAGEINPDGVLTASDQSVDGTVTAKAGGIEGKANVQVTDTIDKLEFKHNGDLIVQKGDEIHLDLNAYYKGSKILIDNKVAEWKVDKSIGTVSDDGVLTITSENGKGEITAKIGDQEISSSVIVGLTEQIVDDFETYDISGYHLSGFMFDKTHYGGMDSNPSFSTEHVKSGNRSLKVSYDSSKWARRYNGTINIVPHWYKGDHWTDEQAEEMYQSYKTDIMPKKFGFWLYGDGKAPWVRLIFDVNGSKKTLDSVWRVDWTGWKYLEVDIPESWELPIVFDYMYSVETNKNIDDYSGTLYLDDLKYIYTDQEQDNNGPEFSDIKPSASTVYKDSFEVSATLTDNLSGVNQDSIQAWVDGEKTDYEYDASTGKISLQVKNLAEGEHTVKVEAEDEEGNLSVPSLERTFTVDLSEDTTPPVIDDVAPVEGVNVQSRTPRVSFKGKDSQSGVKEEDIHVMMGDQKLDVYYDEATGDGYALGSQPFKDGQHHLTITAKDEAGNEMEKVDRTITIESLKQPDDPDHFQVSVIPDTQGNRFSDEVYSRVAKEDTPFAIHVGDIVDTAFKDEYETAEKYKDMLKKPLLIVPGNHESFQGNLDYYYEYFGSPTYHLEYGNTLFIGLNTAYGQSISVSDSTQFHYLKQVLDNNDKKNVVVTNHVLTKDDFETKHEMNPKDAKQLETILGDYKKNHPDSNVQVLFGHLHTLQEWEVDGVTYTVTGNAASKGYVSKEEGNLLGTGLLKVSDDQLNYKFKPLLTEVYIADDSLRNKKMKVATGTKRSLKLFGDFREVTSNYMVELTQFPNVEVEWKSSDESVVKIDDQGEMNVLKDGTAEITATSGEKSSTITIDAVDPEDVSLGKIIIQGDGEITVGEEQRLGLTGIDLYENSFALDGSLADWTSSNENITVNEEGVITAEKAGTTTIEADYGNLKAATSIEIKSSENDEDDGGEHTGDKRLSGDDRYETAVEISKQGWKKADTVVIARGDNFADALAGAPLAYKEDAPILLTSTDRLLTSVREEIQRLGATHAIILGGENAVSSYTAYQLEGIGLDVERVHGTDRFKTAAYIAARLNGSPEQAIVVNGHKFPDALSIAPYAAENGYPILLTEKDHLPAATKNVLRSVSQTVVAGGEGVVNNDVFKELPLGKRYSGKNRFETSAAIAKNLNNTAETAFVSTGNNFADALAGSVLAAKFDGASLLVNNDHVPDSIKEAFDDLGPTNIYILGGPNAVGENVEKELGFSEQE